MRFLGSLLLTLGFIQGCGANDGSSGSGHRLGEFEYVKVSSEGESLTLAETGVSGTGKIAAKNAADEGVKSEQNYKFTFTMEDAGELTLVANGTDALADGVELR